MTPSNWVDEKKCYSDESGILLDSLEIFQIAEYNILKETEENNVNAINNNKSSEKQKKLINKELIKNK